ncbi:MAG: AAA family ATPase [Phycisphaerales bacterium]|nr:AAA family ATPase [Phycisphaerales bacterium]
MRILQRLKISNFKSIRAQELQLQPLNVFIGGNGSGKSNLIGVFRFLKEIVNRNLAGYTQLMGGADSILYHGRKRSPQLEIEVEFGARDATNRYRVRIAGTNDNSLFIAEETAYCHDQKYPKPYDWPIASNTPESRLIEQKDQHQCSTQIFRDLENYRVYHFHDMSDTAPAKGASDINDNRYFRRQAENLAAFLYYLQQRKPNSFSLIEDTVRQIAPFFDRFQLAPNRLNQSTIRLEWIERGSDAYFNAASLSDGTLRFICLCVLLLQPDLPPLILIDEPELGLHPAAIGVLANMLESAATKTQVIVATQSVTLVNQFSPRDVWTVDRLDGQSVFTQLNSADRSHWLENYALGELWEKNLLGARP